MNVECQLAVSEAKVLTDGTPDQAMLNVTATVHHKDEEVLVVAPGKLQFELLNDRGELIGEIHELTDQTGEIQELRPGENATVSMPLSVRKTSIEPDTPYKLACHAFGNTSTVEFKFL